MFKATLEIILKGAKESARSAESLTASLNRAKKSAEALQGAGLSGLERQARSAASATESYAQRIKRAQLEMRALGESAQQASRSDFRPLLSQLDEVEQKAKRASSAFSSSATGAAESYTQQIKRARLEMRALGESAQQASQSDFSPLLSQLDDVEQKAKRVSSAFPSNLANRFGGVVGGLVGGLGTTIGGAFGGGGGVALSAASSAVGAGVATGVGKAGFGKLAFLVGAVSAAIGAVEGVFSELEKTIERQVERFKAIQQNLTNVAAFTATATRSQIEAELTSLQAEEKQNAARREAIKRQIDQVNAAADEVARNNPFHPIIRVAAEAARSRYVGELTKQLDDLEIASNKNKDAQANLRKALEDGTVAANNAARLEQVLKETRLAQNVQAERTTVQLYQDLARAQREGGAKAIRARLDSLRDEEAAIKAALERLNRIPKDQLREDEIQLIAQYTLRLAEIQQIIANTERDILPAAEARDREIEAMERQRRVQEALTRQRERDVQRAIQIVEQLKQLDADFQEKQRLKAEEAAIQARRDSEAAEFQARIERAKEAERAAAVQARIADIERDTARRIADSRAKFAQESLKAARRFNEQRAQIERDFMRRELDALEKFRLSEARRTEDYYRDRNRRLEDLQAQLTELAAEGDVAGFIAAQRAGERDLRRTAEDFDVAGRRASEDFLREREEARRAFEERLADLRNNYAQERAERQRALQDQIADIKRASQERIAQERESLVKRISESQRIEQEFAARRLQWQAEDQARRERLEREGYEKQRAALIEEQKRLLPVVRQAFKPVEQLLNQVGQTALRVLNLFSGGRSSGGRVVANATGGIYTSPTIGLLGERRGFGDIVIPFKKSEGIENALNRFSAKAGNKTVVVNIGQIGGDPQFVRAEIDKLGSRIIEALMSE